MNLLRFKKEELVNVLSKCLSASKKHKDSYTRAVLMEPHSEGPCTIWVNAPENKFVSSIPVYNEEDRINSHFVFELKPFFELVKDHEGEFVSIQEYNKKYRLCIHNGTVDLENFLRMSSKIKDEKFWENIGNNSKTENVEELLQFISIADKAMAFSMISSHKKACIKDGIAYMNFGNIVITMDGFSFDSIGFRSVDFKVLRKALEGSILFNYIIHKNMYLITSGDTQFTVPSVNYEDLYRIRNSVNNYEVKGYVELPFQSLYDVALLISKVTGGSDIVAIECKFGKVFIEASTKIGRKMSFPVHDEMRDVFSVRMSVDLFKKSLSLIHSVVKGEDTVLKISSGTDGRLVFEAGRVRITAGAY